MERAGPVVRAVFSSTPDLIGVFTPDRACVV